MGLSLSQAIAKRDDWLKAEDAVMKGQNYSIEGMSVSRVPVAEIQKNIEKYNKIITSINRTKTHGSAVGRARWS